MAVDKDGNAVGPQLTDEVIELAKAKQRIAALENLIIYGGEHNLELEKQLDGQKETGKHLTAIHEAEQVMRLEAEKREVALRELVLRATNIFVADYPHEPRKSAQERWLNEARAILGVKVGGHTDECAYREPYITKTGAIEVVPKCDCGWDEAKEGE